MIRVRANLERQSLLPLRLEEAGDAVALLGGDAVEDRGCLVKVAAEDGRLVLDDGEGEGVRVDGEVLVRAAAE